MQACDGRGVRLQVVTVQGFMKILELPVMILGMLFWFLI